MILKMCSSFYDASGSLRFLNDEMRNLLEGKLQSINPGGTIQVIALAHRQVSEEELKNDPDLIEKEYCFSLLGFLALKNINQDRILKKVVEECLNAGVGLNAIISEDPVNRAAEFGLPESNQGLKDETLAEGTVTGEYDKSVSMGSGGEEATENSSDIAIFDRESGFASIDQINEAKFCSVEEFTGSEALTSTSPVVLELLKQGIGLNTAENVVACDNFSGSPIEKAILSWVIHELNLDLEEVEKNFSICRSENFNPENQGEKKVLGGHERMLLEQKVQDLESCNCHWVAFVHSQVSQDTTQDCWTLLGMLILDQENPGVKDSVGCPADEVLVSEARDDGVVLDPTHDINIATDDSTVEDGVMVSSEANVSVSMGIEGDETTRSSNIVILDGNYSSLTLILRWASCILHNTQMFLQFQLTTSTTSILNTYISTVSLPGTPGVDTRLVYVLVQLIWVNLGMGLIAAVTFGRQKPQPSTYLMRKPLAEGRKWQLVTGFVWRNIMAQVAY
ncbi:hypothetical protein Pfo_026298 [Paulownia fortunei]|nr:hypothetical protein Pfo_026298 [Paulownia fortunei]